MKNGIKFLTGAALITTLVLSPTTLFAGVHEHDISRSEVTRQAACMEEGVETTFCSCGAVVYSTPIHALGHVEITTVKEAACTEEGETFVSCARCGEILSETPIAAKGHDCEWKTVKKATCAEEGEKQKVCKVCGAVVETKTTAKKEHSYTTETKEATADEDGYIRTYCTECGEVQEETKIPSVQSGAVEEAMGTFGRLYIPDLGIDVALNTCTAFDPGESQPVVNAEDSAAYMPDARAVLIGDHYYQSNFANISGAVPGQTVMYIVTPSGTATHTCVANYQGHNYGNLVSNDGVDVEDAYPGYYVTYTCLDNSGQNVQIVVWQ